MTTCAQIRDLIDDALDGRLDAGSRSAFDAHVRGCAGCAAEWEFASSLRSSLLKVGLDPAPAGLKESIAADVRRVAGQPDTAVTTRRSVFASPPFLRAAAGILVVVAIGWFVMRPKAEIKQGPQAHAPMSENARSDDLVAARPKAQERRTTVDPAGGEWSARSPSEGVEEGLLLRADPRSADALGMVRTIADAGAAATAELNRVGGVPEQRLLQASTLALLQANLAQVTEAAGDAPAIRKLAEDADESLRVFAPPLAKARDEAEKNKMDAVAASSDSDTPPPGAKAEDQVSAAKVTQAKRAQADLDRASGGESSPAFYVVSGPGVIARAGRVLAARGVTVTPVWLKDQDPNERKRAIEQQASEYRIVEADVSESVLNAVVGDLESLDGIRLAPAGRSGDRLQASTGLEAAAAPPTSPKVPPAPGGRGSVSGGGAAGARSATGSQPFTEPPASRSNPLPTRKLRLILIAG